MCILFYFIPDNGAIIRIFVQIYILEGRELVVSMGRVSVTI